MLQEGCIVSGCRCWPCVSVHLRGRVCFCAGMHVDMARWLLEHGADVNRADKDGETALMTAAGSSSTAEPDLVSLLLAKGADGAAQCKTGCTALHLAVNQGKPLHTACGAPTTL